MLRGDRYGESRRHALLQRVSAARRDQRAGRGNVVNEVSNKSNDLGILVTQYQEHDGSKDAGTLYVGYNDDKTAVDDEFTKGLRQTLLRYPNGRLVYGTYGTAGGMA